MNSTSLDKALDKISGGATMLDDLSGWWFYPIDGGSMNKVNQYLFYEFGATLRDLRTMKEGQRFADAFLPAIRAQIALRKFSVETSHIPLKLSKSAAQSLAAALTGFLDFANVKKADGEGEDIDLDKKITSELVSKVWKKLDELETVFSMEAVGLDVYSVTQKGGYSTDTLVQRGEEVIPEEVRDYMSDYARNELHEAGRCLIFDLPTAAGFHMMRSVESVLHSYWDVASGGKARPTEQMLRWGRTSTK